MNLKWTIAFLLCVSPVFAQNPLADLFSPERLRTAEGRGVRVTPSPRSGTISVKFSPANPDGQPIYLFHREPWQLAPGSLTVPVPPAARDWTRYRALTFEFSSNSTITWELQIRNRKGETFTFRVAPFQDVPAKVAISSVFFTRELMYNRQFRGYWLQNTDSHIDMTDVESLTFWMAPNREVVLNVGPFALLTEEVSDEVLLNKPAVDGFGQWIAGEWPGKIHSVSQLRQAWEREDAELAKAEDFGFCAFGGWKARTERATGFFHTAEVNGKWWLVDPDGHLFFSSGPDAARPHSATRVKGREMLFAKLPAGAGEEADFYHANAALRYGETDFASRWKAKTVQRLKAWGFNTIANWADPVMTEDPALPFVTSVSIGSTAKKWLGFPDVYSEEFARAAASDAGSRCARFRDEPKLIGYFIGNEPMWPYHGLVEAILNDPGPSATQSFMRGFLTKEGDSAASRDLLLETIARHYFQSICDAIHKADPNHLTLGIRFSRFPPQNVSQKCDGCIQQRDLPVAVLRASNVFDIVSFNKYSIEPPAEAILQIYGMLKKPVIIGEFHFGAAERGYAPGLVMVNNQTERGKAFQYYLERCAELAPVVGAHYFEWNDEPVAGRRGDGENYDIGLVNELDLAYPEMVSFAKATHRRLYAVHAGDLRPVPWLK